VITSWLPLFEASRLGFEAQCVIGLRLMRLSAGAPPAARETQLIAIEKAAALLQAQAALATAVAAGRPDRVLENTLTTHGRAAQRNRRKLTPARRR